MRLRNLKKRRAQRTRAKNPISAVKSNPREDPRRVALEARQRVLGLPEHLAGHEKAGTVLGRLWLAEVITTPMREAGERYLELHQAYLKALKAPVGLAKGGGSANEAEPSEDYVEWAIRAVAHYEVMKAALRPDGYWLPVEMTVIGEVEPAGLHMPALINGLGLLARKMGLDRKVAA